MIRQILFPFDFSAQSLLAVPHVRAFASRFHARLTIVSVVPPVFEAMPAVMGARDGDDVRDWIQALQARVEQANAVEFSGLPVECIADHGDAGFRIVDVAHGLGVDLIMMPTHGHGLFRSLLVGSATSRVLHDAHCPVWTATHAEEQRAHLLPRTILCAVDSGPASVALLKWAGEFSARVGAALTLLHVTSRVTDWPALESERALQDQVTHTARAKIEALQAAAGVTAPLRVAVGEIVATITDRAREEEADLVLIGRAAPLSAQSAQSAQSTQSTQSTQFQAGRLRPHAYGIIQQSPCPVLSV